MGEGHRVAEVGGDFEEGVLDCGLGESDVGNMGLETADAPGKG